MEIEQPATLAPAGRRLPGWLRTSSLNMALRGLTLGSKFILLLFMARFLSPAELGLYGLMAVSVGLSLFVVGCEFYVFNAREILASDKAEWPRLIRDQFVFHGLAYAASLPFLLLLFATGLLPWSGAPWFMLLLVLEHTSQEAYRLLSTLSRPLLANVVLFFRAGIWIYAAAALMLAAPAMRSLPVLWGAWALGGVLSLVVAGVCLRDIPWRLALAHPIDWTWIRKGFVGSLPFLGSSLALTGIDSIDRYFIKAFHGPAQVGAYSFYASLANAVQAFLFSGVIMILYPKIITAFQGGDMEAYRKLMRSLTRGIVAGLAVLVTLAALGVHPVLWLTDKPFYREFLPLYWVLLASVSIAGLSMIPHYGLYARRLDRPILHSALVALAVAAVANWLLVPRLGALGAALSTLAATATIGLFKLGALVAAERKTP